MIESRAPEGGTRDSCLQLPIDASKQPRHEAGDPTMTFHLAKKVAIFHAVEVPSYAMKCKRVSVTLYRTAARRGGSGTHEKSEQLKKLAGAACSQHPEFFHILN